VTGHFDLILALVAFGYLVLILSIWNERARRRCAEQAEQESRRRVRREIVHREQRGAK
jgi:hypothetical protein